jgi:hypothetical protein
VAIILMTAFMRPDSKTEDLADVRTIHPAAFELVTCWNSDSEQPVVTEINLDAVRKNRNQFDAATVRSTGDWVECPGHDDHGFRRFRVISSDKNVFTVEFQSNSEGTLTTATRIEFILETREIRSAGKARPVSVLRVMSVEAR